MSAADSLASLATEWERKQAARGLAGAKAIGLLDAMLKHGHIPDAMLAMTKKVVDEWERA